MTSPPGPDPGDGPVRRALAGALALVFPVACAGCDTPDVVLCPGCRRRLRPEVRVRTVDAVPVCSGLEFAGVPARVLRAVKADGRTELARALAPALAAAAHALPRRHDGGVPAVVPVPTSPAALRRRGYRVTELLARRAGMAPQRLLRTRGGGDQRTLGRAARAANVAGTMSATARPGLRVLVVDDVVTTGATLAEAFRALRARGAVVVGAVTVAATPRLVVDGDDGGRGA